MKKFFEKYLLFPIQHPVCQLLLHKGQLEGYMAQPSQTRASAAGLTDDSVLVVLDSETDKFWTNPA